MNVDQIFGALGLEEKNPGAFAGAWISTSGEPLQVFNPATGELLGTVIQATEDEYEQVIASSIEAFDRWRMLPAPKRGEYVRLLGQELRKYKTELGALVSLEMGKILPEGEGEVQEMI
ncbi:MAG: aldehyde dehydrogenase family protein, partial [Acidimicrobiia bacterium]|nr:aldehyde dehydrogenase family protein [Acidimicrobiia bacterium]